MFSLGTAEARAAGLRDAAVLPDVSQLALPGTPVNPAAVQRALSTVVELLAHGTEVAQAEVLPGNGATAALHITSPGESPAAFMRLGADVHRLRVALAAEGVPSVVLPHEDGIRLDLSGS
jgi:coenzyme F420-0:L-glutamate ligase/coenzyme F420-1:gamma-L-glutamate ligase